MSEGAPSGVDAPGFWPWQDLYAEALVGVGRVDDADAFLAPHEALAAGARVDERAAGARARAGRGRAREQGRRDRRLRARARA